MDSATELQRAYYERTADACGALPEGQESAHDCGLELILPCSLRCTRSRC